MSDEPQRPTSHDDRDGWKAHWAALGMPWRTEPEIDEERQEFLAERRIPTTVVVTWFRWFDFPLVEHPLENIRLERADVEWLLATHESDGMHGPIDIEDEKQQRREGLDLGEADLHSVDLRGLPLARLHATEANLRGAHLEGASLVEGRLEGADLRGAYLDSATLLTDVWFGNQRGDVYARVRGTRGLRRWVSVVSNVFSDFALIFYLVAGLALAFTIYAAIVVRTPISLGGVSSSTILDVLTIVDLLLVFALVITAIRLLPLRSKDNVSALKEVFAMVIPWVIPLVHVTTGALLADVHWGGANLALVDWQRMKISGDEVLARRWNSNSQRKRDWEERLAEFQAAVRCYRQLAVELGARGLNEEGDYFAYQAHRCQRGVLLRQYKPVQWLGSSLLNIVSGYGYRPLRSVRTYLLVVTVFAWVYWAVGLRTGHALTWNEAGVVSLTAFHGRGFVQTTFQPGDPQAALAAIEAVIGLLIEIIFIATFTQRLFAR